MDTIDTISILGRFEEPERKEITDAIIECCIVRGLDVSTLEESITAMRKGRIIEGREGRPAREVLEEYCDRFGFDSLVDHLAERMVEDDEYND